MSPGAEVKALAAEILAKRTEGSTPRHGDGEAHHVCHWVGCHRKVPPRMWGCRYHWMALPRVLRDRIWAAYRPGQERDKRPSAEYLRWAMRAQEYSRAVKDGSLARMTR